jgi:hypothetical protein
LVAGAAFGLAAALFAESVEEKFPDGKLKLKYSTDKEGRKDGIFLEYRESGKPKFKATYKADELNGPYTTYHENGFPFITASYKKGKYSGAYGEKDEKGCALVNAFYKDGKLDGALSRFEAGRLWITQTFKNGEPAFPRTREQIQKKVAEILAVSVKARPDDPMYAERHAALLRLRAYRYLCEVPYEDVILDDEMNRLADAASKICAKIGRLDHRPPNPGLPEAEYKYAYKGTSSSNLSQGRQDMAATVDGYMNDSDMSNIDRAGHRRWCINPAMTRTGFGRSGVFSAMYSFDAGRKMVPDYDFVAYPARGFFPVEFFGPRHAWNVSLNPKKFRRPEPTAVKYRVYPLDEMLARPAEPLKIDYSNVETTNFGIGLCLIFRPEGIEVAPGKRYYVEIDGVPGIDGKPSPIRYLVEFISAK